MATATFNPYVNFGPQFTAGLTAVVDDLEPLFPNQTVEDLNTAVFDFISSIFYPSPMAFDMVELKSILPFAINNYINAECGGAFSQYNPH